MIDDPQDDQQQLEQSAHELRDRINRFRKSLGRFLVAKQELIDLMVVAAVAQEPLLLVGGPGTAKSDLVLKFKDALGVPSHAYFEYMLTRFTEPSEIIGPIDINQLREGRYVRREEGKLPSARIAFLDEIFKSNSAILNILLTIINERKFYQDGQPQPVALRILFAATNEIPEQEELLALKDRFTLKAESRSVHNEHFSELIDSGIRGEVQRGMQAKPWAEDHCTLDDILKVHRHLLFQFQQSGRDGDAASDRERFFPGDVFRDFQRIVTTLEREDRLTSIWVGGHYQKGQTAEDYTEAIEKALADIQLPPGYTWNFHKETKEKQERYWEFAESLILALILIFAVMAGLFESVQRAIALMIALPFAIS
ncbi:MAG: efflux RND transporter permease subunit, partial [Planctomycetaceae bacterium]